MKYICNFLLLTYCCFKMRKCKILGWVGQQFVNVYKGVGSVNVNQCQQVGWVGQKRPKICKHSLWTTPYHKYKDLVDKRPWKLTSNSENALFLMTHLQLLVQDKQISCEYVDLHAKRLLILGTWVWLSTT